MTFYRCIANDPDGLEITPRSLSRIRQGKYCVPDCVDYQTKFNLPRRIKSREVFAGWNCHNCKFLQENSAPKNESVPIEASDQATADDEAKASDKSKAPDKTKASGKAKR